VTPFSGITTISFDVDGTLWDFEGLSRRALQGALRQLAKVDPDAAGRLDVERLVALRNEIHTRMLGSVTDLDAVREESMREALREAGRPDDDLASHMAQAYFRSRDELRTLFPDARPTLERLAPDYKLGLLSNGNSRADALGISDLISFEVFSQDHGGIEKPDPRLFEIALHEACCEPHELLHVGDWLESDVVGALNVGAQAVLLSRNGASPDCGDVPEIRSLAELPSLLQTGQVAEALP
jgi:putative hydrolase of the HAD superfamily